MCAWMAVINWGPAAPCLQVAPGPPVSSRLPAPPGYSTFPARPVLVLLVPSCLLVFLFFLAPAGDELKQKISGLKKNFLSGNFCCTAYIKYVPPVN